jgi:hypothetical protein
MTFSFLSFFPTYPHRLANVLGSTESSLFFSFFLPTRFITADYLAAECRFVGGKVYFNSLKLDRQAHST